MTQFVSTRGGDAVSFAEALVHGLAPDGGLYVPTRLAGWRADSPPRAGSFAESATWAGTRLLEDAVDADVVARVVADSLDFEVPVVEVRPGVFVMELFHGPTLAFKDVGARFMARAMAVLADASARRTVLVATSGDTGGAVASAFHGLDRHRVVVLFPAEGISARQRHQMTTLGDNVQAVAVAGTFDDCQRLAKDAFADRALAETCGLTSANSINIGRLIPQSLYYVHAAARLGWVESPATFVVPSGNLGNICAGLIAKRMGTPMAGFVAAANRNHVFPDYLASGQFIPRASVETLSNAMDVGNPSNLERIRWLYGDDLTALRQDVRGTWIDDATTRGTIGEVYREHGYVLDPHGAVGWAAMDGTRPHDGPVVVLATAHPAKFPEVVEEATRAPVEVPTALAARLDAREDYRQLPPDPGALKDLLLEGYDA